MKLRNKLILSCAALAAVATTAVSTTFAWYTNNTEVTAKGVSGTTLTADQSVLMISKDDYNWGSKVQLNISSLNLVPVQNASGTFTKWTQANNAADASATANTDYLTFDLYFKSGTTDSLNVYIKQFNLVNTTAASGLPSKIKLNKIGLPISETTYTVDMFRALTIDQNAFTTTEKLTENEDLPSATANSTYTKVWDCQSLAGTDSLSGLSAGTQDGNYDAHRYYNAVKGLETNTTSDTADDPIDTTKTNSETTRADLANTSANGYEATSWKLGETGAGSTVATTASSVLKITFVIYLDGWDKACFDACQGQSFTLDMEFTATKVATQSGSGSGNGGSGNGGSGNGQ